MSVRRRGEMAAFCSPVSLGLGTWSDGGASGRLCSATIRKPVFSLGRTSAFRRPRLVACANSDGDGSGSAPASVPANASTPRIQILAIATATRAEKTEALQESDSNAGGFLGLKARAYWNSIGFLPLFFGGLGILALTIKAIKVMQGRWTSTDGVNRAMTPESIITTEEQERELHVFKCGGCGYEMYPARGREFKFFPDNFKCPLCGSPKSEFWDLKDPNDPRNREDDEDADDLQTAASRDDPSGTGKASESK